MFLCQPFNLLPGKTVLFKRRRNSGPETIIIAVCIRAVFRCAAALFQKTEFLLGGQCQIFQPERAVYSTAQNTDCLFCRISSSPACCQLKYTVGVSFAHRLECRKDTAHRFTRSGRRLTEQNPSIPESPENLACHLPLSRPVTFKWKDQLRQ